MRFLLAFAQGGILSPILPLLRETFQVSYGELGLLISMAGPVTYKNARALPDVARFAPEDRLVVETDCPFLPPHPHRGQRNEPAYIELTLARVAELRGVAPEALAEATTQNAARLFALKELGLP